MEVIRLYNNKSLRNFTYLLVDVEQRVYCIDPYHGGRVIEYLEKRGLSLTAIINTHEHGDHSYGNRELVQRYQCRVYVHRSQLEIIAEATTGVGEGDQLPVSEGHLLKVLETPGHTAGHICLLLQQPNQPAAFFSGDTIFHAGVGNCKNGGNVNVLYQTIQRLMDELTEDTILYPGHDYLQTNLRFLLHHQPENSYARAVFEKSQQLVEKGEFYQATWATEKKINPFLRCLAEPESREKFIQLRRKRDVW